MNKTFPYFSLLQSYLNKQFAIKSLWKCNILTGNEDISWKILMTNFLIFVENHLNDTKARFKQGQELSIRT